MTPRLVLLTFELDVGHWRPPSCAPFTLHSWTHCRSWPVLDAAFTAALGSDEGLERVCRALRRVGVCLPRPRRAPRRRSARSWHTQPGGAALGPRPHPRLLTFADASLPPAWPHSFQRHGLKASGLSGRQMPQPPLPPPPPKPHPPPPPSTPAPSHPEPLAPQRHGIKASGLSGQQMLPALLQALPARFQQVRPRAGFGPSKGGARGFTSGADNSTHARPHALRPCKTKDMQLHTCTFPDAAPGAAVPGVRISQDLPTQPAIRPPSLLQRSQPFDPQAPYNPLTFPGMRRSPRSHLAARSRAAPRPSFHLPTRAPFPTPRADAAPGAAIPGIRISQDLRSGAVCSGGAGPDRGGAGGQQLPGA